MNGILIVDKPKGMTSFDVVRQVRRLTGVRRVGHAGTLDPMATGVLPVAVGDGTRILEFLFDGDKAYRATLKFGETTDTQDADGAIVETGPLCGVTQERIESELKTMTGEIHQVPPMYSALKRDGVPLYRLARQGVEVERQARTVVIHRIELLEVALPFVTLELECSKGTYVRTLAHDLGQTLGAGAHLTALRRIRCGPFDESESHTLEQLQSRIESLPLLPLESALRQFPSVSVNDSAADRLCDGIPPSLSELGSAAALVEGGVTVLLAHGKLRSLARFAPSRSREKRGDFELLKVFRPS